MNEKEKHIYNILDIVVDECAMVVDGNPTVTREDVLGKSKKENVLMTRNIFATQIMFAGYSKDTLSLILHRTNQAVDDILNAAHQYRIQSWAYRVAEAKATLRCKELMKQCLT